MTPAPSPGAPSNDRPTGASPTAKRPLDRASIQVSQSGFRPMSNEDLAQGFMNLHAGAERDAKWTQSIAESVHGNAELLNALIERVNNIEASATLTVGKVNSHGSQIEQIESRSVLFIRVRF